MLYLFEFKRVYFLVCMPIIHIVQAWSILDHPTETMDLGKRPFPWHRPSKSEEILFPHLHISLQPLLGKDRAWQLKTCDFWFHRQKGSDVYKITYNALEVLRKSFPRPLNNKALKTSASSASWWKKWRWCKSTTWFTMCLSTFHGS